MKFKLGQLLVALAVVGSSVANAGVVTIWGETPYGLNQNAMNSFYNGLSGHSSSIATGDLNTVNLTGVNLLWATQPSNAYTAAELTTMANFLAGGGRIAFMGEHGSGLAVDENNRINAAVLALGGNMVIHNDNALDGGFQSASVGDGQILAHTLTTGVNTYQYAAFAPITLSGTAVALMMGQDPYLGNPSIMMAYQNIGAGSIFLITDQNVWDNAPTWGSFDNERMFENLLSGVTGAPPAPPVNSAPEPATLGLLGLGLAGLGALRRRRKA